MGPTNLDRRRAMALGLLAGVGAAGAARAGPRALTVAEALAARRSTRAFADRAVDGAARDAVLWAAGGVNRPASGGRTAPSWHGAADQILHVAEAGGTALYDPAGAVLRPLGPTDVRARLSPQPWVATAPLCLVHVSDVGRLRAAAPGTPDEDLRLAAHADAAVAAQNVYLVCAAMGLGTCLVGGIDRAAIAEAFALGPDRVPVYLQPVGWPA